jgi:hypothetical protein
MKILLQTFLQGGNLRRVCAPQDTGVRIGTLNLSRPVGQLARLEWRAS